MSNGQTKVTLGWDDNLNWDIKGFIFFSGKNFEEIMKPNFIYKPLDNNSVVYRSGLSFAFYLEMSLVFIMYSFQAFFYFLSFKYGTIFNNF